ncbi:tape measure protein [Dietzia alimentaria]|uniref:tape measure protein n=1 Tax=Dietzia alimentaria TaxID=665550 RepID=UPI00029AB710|nr:tape measure protein [Dietzia alimentaria]
MTELATGYISLVVETSKIPKQVGDAMKGVESQADKTGKSMGGKLASGLGKSLKVGAGAAGVAAGAALGTAITKGIGRLSGIENAEASLTGLGHSASAVDSIMENALNSVRGTSYGLEEAASIAASAVAAGVKPGKDLERTLGLVGDAAAIAGTDLGEMGSIVNKVATSDMMQMDVANQLMDAGIPILQLVAAEMGVTADEARKMASEGKVSFETFQNALESGMGGAALELGNTVGGAFRNMGAAAGRFGATLAGPFFSQAAGAFTGVTGLIDNMNDAFKPVMADFEAWLVGSGIPGLRKFGASALDTWNDIASSDVARTSLVRLGGVVDQLVEAGSVAGPALGRIVTSLGEASAAIGISTWEMLLSVLESSATILNATLVPALDMTAGLMEDNQGAVTALVAAYMAFKTVPAIMGRVGAAFSPIVAGGKSARGSLSDFSGAVRDSYRWMGQANPEMGRLGLTASVLGSNAGAAAKGGLNALKSAGSSLLGVFGGPLGAAFAGVTVAVTAGIGAHRKLESSQRALEDASQNLAVAQTDMWSQIGDASGVADSVVAQLQAVRAEMDAAIAGEQRGFGAFMSRAGQDFVQGAKFWSADAYGESHAKEAQDRANALHDAAKVAKEALDELGMSNDDVAAAISGAAGDWDAFAARLLALGDNGAAALDKLQPLRDEFELLQEAQKVATPGALELSAAVDTLADSAASADDKLSAMEDALKALGIMASDAETSAFELAAAVQEVVDEATKGADAAGGLGKELLTLDGGLDGSKANAQALTGELGTLGAKFRQHAQDTGDASAAYDAVRPALEALAETYDLPIGKIEEFAAQWGGIDRDAVQLLIGLDGADETTQKLAEVAAKFGSLDADEPKVFTTRLDEASKADTIAALEAVGYKVDEIDGKPGMVRITADSSVASAAMGAVTQRLLELDVASATPDILADDTIFRLTDASTQDALRQLDTTQVDPAIGAIIDDFINGRDVTLAELARINATVADPHIKATIDEALQKAKIVNDALNEAARERTARIVGQYIPPAGYADRMVSTGGTQVGHHANGAVVDYFANGSENHVAQIAPAGSMRVWAEPETGGEAYIPLAESKRGRSEQILSQVADRFGYKLEAFADGGIRGADEMLDFVRGTTGDGQSRPLEGAPYNWGGVNWGDCSGAMSAIARFGVGLAPFAGRFATGNQREALMGMGFSLGSGTSGDLRFGWFNGGPYGGHTAGTLPDGTNVEMGGGRGNGQIGGPAAGASHPQFTDHAFLPMRSFDWSDKAYTGRRGAGLTIGEFAVDRFTGKTNFASSPGMYSSPGNSGRVAPDQPRTWSDMAAGAAASLVSGQVSDVLGVFGVPDQLPPIVQAWQMLNERPGGGPSDWDLSTAAAEVQRLNAAIELQERFTDEAAQGLDVAKSSPLGDPLVSQMMAAEDELAKAIEQLDRDREARRAAQARLGELLDARDAALEPDEPDVKKMSDRDLADAATAKPDEADPLDVDYDPAAGAAQWAPVVREALRRMGLPLSHEGRTVEQIDIESTGDPRAVNGDDSNAAAGTPSKGLLQVIDPTYRAMRAQFADAFSGTADDIFDPLTNTLGGLGWVQHKWGGPEKRWPTRDGYFMGGPVGLPNGMAAGVDNVPAWLTVGERVVRNGPSQLYADDIDAMNAGTYKQGGGEVHYHFHVLSQEEAERRKDALQRQHATGLLGARG